MAFDFNCGFPCSSQVTWTILSILGPDFYSSFCKWRALKGYSYDVFLVPKAKKESIIAECQELRAKLSLLHNRFVVYVSIWLLCLQLVEFCLRFLV